MNTYMRILFPALADAFGIWREQPTTDRRGLLDSFVLQPRPNVYITLTEF